MKRVGVICYDRLTRKAYDVLCLLRASGYNICVYTVPWKERKVHTPLYRHRPSDCPSMDVADIMERIHRIDGRYLADYEWEPDELGKLHPVTFQEGPTIIAGCGILSPEIVNAGPIINAHPGYLPHDRGLDALKWAIYHGHPIGVTTHIIEEEPDCGQVIAQEHVPVYFNDTFHSVAYRQYETEIRMLVEAVEREPSGIVVHPEGKVNRRMPHRKEIVMMERFEKLRRSRG